MAKKKYTKWTDLDRAVIITHHRKWGVANKETLYDKLSHRGVATIDCELSRFDCWRKTGIMEFKASQKYANHRAGTIEKYKNLINLLNL